MASPRRRLAANAPGPFYVDDTCIDCGMCRWFAPETFGDEDGGEHSIVTRQPADEPARRRARMALVACPTGSIGDTSADAAALRAAAAAFPVPAAGAEEAGVAAGVYHCGYHAPASFGATAYLIVRPGGNVLVDSPRFAAPLVRRLEELGGVRWMFLTHRDDVADHARFAEHFSCRRVLHRADVTAATRAVEQVLEGDEPARLADDLLAIPTPGHTAGSACLLLRDEVLFSGDHLAWSPSRRRLIAFRDACWFDWRRQTDSMERLAGFRFVQVLPGHGAPARMDSREAMAAALRDCVAWMRGR